MKDKVKVIIQTDTYKEKIKEHERYFQEVLDTFKSSNLRIYGVEGTEVQFQLNRKSI